MFDYKNVISNNLQHCTINKYSNIQSIIVRQGWQ